MGIKEGKVVIFGCVPYTRKLAVIQTQNPVRLCTISFFIEIIWMHYYIFVV